MKTGHPNKNRHRVRLVPTKAQFRSALTNGSILGHEIDGRSAFMRRVRDLIYTHEADLGGDNLSEGQRAIVRRISMLEVQLAAIERKWAEAEGAAPRQELETYQRVSNTVRRLLESLNLHKGRVARDATTLGDLLREDHARQREQRAAREEAQP